MHELQHNYLCFYIQSEGSEHILPAVLCVHVSVVGKEGGVGGVWIAFRPDFPG